MAYDISDAGLRFIMAEEGRVVRNGRHVLYNDPVGHCTVGYGHLVHRGRCDGRASEAPYRNGITEDEALALKRKDARRFVDALNRLVTVPLTQNQVDALVSLMFNIGEGAPGVEDGFYESTVRRRLNARDYQGAADAFLMWKWADGRPILLGRRERERAMFLSDATKEAPDVPDMDHLHPTFRQRVEAACRATGASVLSAARSTERQAELYECSQNCRSTCSSCNPANRPGTSWHEYGDGIPSAPYAYAVDFVVNSALDRLRARAAEFGLVFNISGEKWHAQPVEIAESYRVYGAENRLPLPVISKEDEVFSQSPIPARHITAAHSGLLVTANGGAHGSAVIQARSNGALGQRWMLVGHEDGTISLVSRDGEKALDVPDGRNEPGVALQVADTVYNSNQRFRLAEVEANEFVISVPGTDLVLDVAGADSNEGSRLILWSWTGGLNQVFRLSSSV